MRQSFVPGDETWYASDAPVGHHSVVFEDDGDTGYFYAVERCGEELKILDAVQIYAVRNVVDREIPSELEITWARSGPRLGAFQGASAGMIACPPRSLIGSSYLASEPSLFIAAPLKPSSASAGP